MQEIAATVRSWRDAGNDVALASVVSTQRSAPRPIGATMAVAANGSVIGSVSGGCVEADVCRIATEVLSTGVPQLVRYGITDAEALDVGLPCGGEIEVFVEAPGAAVVDRLVSVPDGDRMVVFTVVEGDAAGAKLVVPVDPAGPATGDGPAELRDRVRQVIDAGRPLVIDHHGVRVLADLVGPVRELVVVGAYDIAEQLCALAARLGWRTTVVDARERFATAERVPSAQRIVVDWPHEALARIAPDRSTAIVVLSHDPKFDVPALKAALETPAFYVGALGSRSNQRRRRPRLLEAGVPEDRIARIHGPCGLDLGGATPAETALSIVGEIVAVGNGRTGAALSGEHGPPIHPREPVPVVAGVRD